MCDVIAVVISSYRLILLFDDFDVVQNVLLNIINVKRGSVCEIYVPPGFSYHQAFYNLERNIRVVILIEKRIVLVITDMQGKLVCVHLG